VGRVGCVGGRAKPGSKAFGDYFEVSRRLKGYGARVEKVQWYYSKKVNGKKKKKKNKNKNRIVW
jgi:hypothetical protein